MPAKIVNIRKYRPTVEKTEHKKRQTWQGHDDVFLHRDQISVGVELVNYGRLYHGTLWTVAEIKTLSPGGKTSKVQNVNRFSDKIVLVQVGTNNTMQLNFSNLSYSAIWRIAR